MQFLVVSSALDLKTVLGLWLGGLEWAGEDAHLGVAVNFLHLGVGELLVEDDTFNEAGVFEGAASLGDDLDEVEVDVATLEVGNVQDSSQSQVSVLVLALADDLGAECGLSALSQLSVVVLEDIKLLLDLTNAVDGDVTSLLETISDFEWVDAFIQKFLGLLKDGSSEDDNTCGTVTNLVVLGSGKLGQESGSLMMDLINQEKQSVSYQQQTIGPYLHCTWASSF